MKTQTPQQHAKPASIAFVFAMQEEQQGLEHQLQDKKVVVKGKRRYLTGNLWGQACVCVLSGIGKVAAASTATSLIENFDVGQIVLIGVAGAADPGLSIGDIVIATTLVQHDMDASPLFPRFEIPLTGISHLSTDARLSRRLSLAADFFLENDRENHISDAAIAQFNLQNVKIRFGLVASGDQFINDPQILAGLKKDLPDLLAVEMEGAAIAQVCHDFEIPFAILRTISDDAGEHADYNFSQFIKEVAAQYSLGILHNFCIQQQKQQ
ncbi:5'-methylthioadenosine/adenosylhomocysteine nucleosidase [Undibacterium sp.]|jgi:adenosylhomocysteine nucleosidase|uniref:5'-methylthioadenosine/adenosylhomocysteine nucleosidase n=1 Tax=Undibacterium sp. TaxID=1914977 RepID=UPI002B8E36F6|nr:5'-methylthioadenosine/adenosylhomocysteine nucleosidase [Undibacterium sp.]HTD05454.1 5'-methylthioadenosine/adenosylhomocysteine nucleosidase [Undibacterium sp.]